jgi:hypothetical protein
MGDLFPTWSIGKSEYGTPGCLFGRGNMVPDVYNLTPRNFLQLNPTSRYNPIASATKTSTGKSSPISKQGRRAQSSGARQLSPKLRAPEALLPVRQEIAISP